MLALNDIPAFSGISESGLQFLSRSATLRHFPAGSLICRKGESGLGLFAIAAGSVQVHLDQDPTGQIALILMGEGQILGEMSVITDMPISANVVALDAHIYFIPKRDFLELLENEPALQKALMQMLVDRIRQRSSFSADQYAPKCTVILLPPAVASENFRNALCRAIRHYAPGSYFIRQVGAEEFLKRAQECTDSPYPSFFPAPPPDIGAVRRGDQTEWLIPENAEWLSDLIRNWRISGAAGQWLVLLLTESTAVGLRDKLIRGDTVLSYPGLRRNVASPYFGLAEYGSARRSRDPRTEEEIRQANWSFPIEEPELDRAGHLPPCWDRSACPTIDWIARWMTHREVGIALGAGAARGFAHLGVLQVLEEEGIPIDYACGTSMGGAIATIYAKTGNAGDTTRIIRSLIGGNDRIRDLRWFPKSSLMAGKKLEKAITLATDGSHFAELRKPAAVVASDLVRRERCVFERGSTRLALLATTAIPGVFPPVMFENRILVDGALLSRVPLDLLEKRRCGLKMAVNVTPSPELREERLDCERMKSYFNQFFGFRQVITNAWEILAWWHGASEAETADVVIEPRTDPHSGYDFDSVDALIEAGRKAARRKLGDIQRSLDSLLKPGIP